MKKRNLSPLIMSALLIVLIGGFSFLRLCQDGIWKNSAVNVDMVIVIIYIVWILLEFKTSVREVSQGDKTSDFGTCELYAIGQAGVILSALWFNSIWKSPNGWHAAGFILFMSGIYFRLWAVKTLGRYYSHIVREVDGHKIITSGPYRFIRHPAYAGMILAHAGITIFFFNAVAGLILLCVLIPAIILRIKVEEKTLYSIDGYADFAKLRKRLFPGIW